MPTFKPEPSQQQKESVEQAGNLAELQLLKAVEIAKANNFGSPEVIAALIIAISSNHDGNMRLLTEVAKRATK